MTVDIGPQAQDTNTEPAAATVTGSEEKNESKPNEPKTETKTKTEKTRRDPNARQKKPREAKPKADSDKKDKDSTKKEKKEKTETQEKSDSDPKKKANKRAKPAPNPPKSPKDEEAESSAVEKPKKTKLATRARKPKKPTTGETDEAAEKAEPAKEKKDREPKMSRSAARAAGRLKKKAAMEKAEASEEPKPDEKAAETAVGAKKRKPSGPKEKKTDAKADGASQKLKKPRKSKAANAQDGGARKSGRGVSANPENQLTGDALEKALGSAIDNLFQFESLSTNVFLLSKMDQYMYIPVKIIQRQRLIKDLTTSSAAVMAALKQSKAVILSSERQHARPNLAMQRTVIILRNISGATSVDDVRSLFGGCKANPTKVRCEVADNWFVHFNSAEETLTAYEHVKDQKFNGQPLAVRIKSINMPVLFNRSAFRSDVVPQAKHGWQQSGRTQRPAQPRKLPPAAKLDQSGSSTPFSGSSTPLNPNAKEFVRDESFASTEVMPGKPLHSSLPRNKLDSTMRKGLGRGMRSDQLNDGGRGGRGSAKEGGRGGAKRILHLSQQQTLELQENHFMHVKERPTGNIRCEIGPKMVNIGPNEMVQRPPQPLIEIPPDHFCVVRNPVRKNAFGNVLLGDKDKLKLRYGDKDVRLHSYGSFALFPGEQLVEPVQRMQQVPEGQALQLRALRAFLDKSPYLPNPMWRVSGDTWLFMGPAQYLPHAEAEVVGLVTPIVIQPNTALELKATNDFIDNKSGKLRNKGDVWLVRQTGPFLAGLDEEAVQVKTGHDVTITEALHVRAETNLTDAFGIQRSTGDEWLVTTRNKIVYIPEINETVVGIVQPTHVTSMQFCVLEERVREDEKEFKHRKVVQGDKKFFLQPNQRLVIKPSPKFVLNAGEALELKVMEPFMDEQIVQPRSPAYMSAHLAVVFALLAYLVTQPMGEMLSGSSLILAFGTLLLCFSLLIPRQGVQVLERNTGSTYLVYGPLADYVPSAQVEHIATKKATMQVPALGIFAFYQAESG